MNCTRRKTKGLLALLVLAIGLTASCSGTVPQESFRGTWSFWSNRLGTENQYLFIEKTADSELWLLVHGKNGRIVRQGTGHFKENTLVANFDDGRSWTLTLSPKGELRASFFSDEELEENSPYGSSYVFYRPIKKELD